MNELPKTHKIRVPELDILRFLAASLVLLYHYTYRRITSEGVDIATFPIISLFSKFGFLGVDLFFLISGFVIFVSATATTPLNFVASRAARLYPVFWLCLFITAATTAILDNKHATFSAFQLLGNATMLGGYLNVDYIDGVYWSLQVEIKFYFLVFLILVAGQINKAEFWLYFWLLATCIERTIFPSSIIKMIFITEYSCYFIAGAFFYLIRTSGINIKRVFSVFACCVVACTTVPERVSGNIFFNFTPYDNLISATTIVVFFVTIGMISTQKIKLKSFKFLAKLGALTYPLYLLHNKAGKIIFDCITPVLNSYISLAIVTALMFFCAYWVANVYDKHTRPAFERKLVVLFKKIALSANSQGNRAL